MRITKRNIINIISSRAEENDILNIITGWAIFGGLLGVSLFGMCAMAIHIGNPQSFSVEVFKYLSLFSAYSVAGGLVSLVALHLTGHDKKRQNKVLQDSNINTTMDDIEQMSDDQLNELCAEPLFSKYRPLSDEEIIVFNHDVKKYGTRDQIQKWTEYLHQVRETPLSRVRQYMTGNFKTQLEEQKKHTDTPLKVLLDELLVDEQVIETDDLIVSKNKRCS